MLLQNYLRIQSPASRSRRRRTLAKTRWPNRRAAESSGTPGPPIILVGVRPQVTARPRMWPRGAVRVPLTDSTIHECVGTGRTRRVQPRCSQPQLDAAISRSPRMGSAPFRRLYFWGFVLATTLPECFLPDASMDEPQKTLEQTARTCHISDGQLIDMFPRQGNFSTPF